MKEMESLMNISNPAKRYTAPTSARCSLGLKAAFMIAALLCTSFLHGCSRPEGGIVIAGSTSVQPYVEILSEEFASLYPDIAIDIQGGGSSAGITAAEAGTAQIGMSSRSLKDKELDRGLWSVEIAKDGLAVIVHPENPVKGLTYEQVRSIYAGEIVNWEQVGGNNAKIHLIAREEGSGTRSAFEDLFMGEKYITPKAIVQNSNGSVKQLVADDKNSIGFISLGLCDSKVAALELNGVAATHENIVNGSYQMYRPFLFVANSEPIGDAKLFIDYILSDEGQKLLLENGLIPATEGIEKG
ncbi:MAG: phosphate ABC transporter substrate-binding protein [Oscillospiraceae bacterium]|jgi:phosphate transport system substrate-binding protein|nr:phosphate ABC transporter substrate-binding protein [Oscillospiraceae bacterium]